MTDFVLVHGAWQGSSTWEPILAGLKGQGDRAFTPGLTGAGPRAYELSSHVGVEHHVQDVLGCLTFENLEDVVLVGHSYAGMVVTEVVERCPGRVAKLVYIDAFVPKPGQSVWDLIPEWLKTPLTQQLEDGWRLPGFEKRLDLWGLKDGPERDFVRTKLCDFPMKCFKDPVLLETDAAAALPRAYLASVAESYPARSVFEPFGARAKQEGWDYFELDTGHDSHVEAPDECVKILLSLK